MKPDYDAMKKKDNELKRLALSKIPDDSSTDKNLLIDRLFDSYVQISAPMNPPIEIRMITMDSMGRDGARSRKPGNIILNLRKLLQIVPDITITAAGVTGPTWLLPFIALHIWNKLWTGSKVDLDQKHAVTICALWKNRNNENKISEEAGFEKANLIFQQLKLPVLSKSEYTQIINDFLYLNCIEIEEGIIWLREWVRVSY